MGSKRRALVADEGEEPAGKSAETLRQRRLRRLAEAAGALDQRIAGVAAATRQLLETETERSLTTVEVRRLRTLQRKTEAHRLELQRLRGEFEALRAERLKQDGHGE